MVMIVMVRFSVVSSNKQFNKVGELAHYPNLLDSHNLGDCI